MLAKIRNLLGKAVDTHEAVPQIDFGDTHLVAGRSAGEHQSVVVVLLLGLDQETMQEIIEQTRPTSDIAPLPIFVIDTLEFDMFARDDEVFEYVPSTAAQKTFSGALPWDRYLESRLELLLLKWHPVSIIPFGTRSRDVLTAWEEARAARKLMAEGQH